MPHLGIKDIVRVPKEDSQPLAHKKKPRGGSQHPAGRVKSEAPEAGMDELTDAEGIVWCFEEEAEKERGMPPLDATLL